MARNSLGWGEKTQKGGCHSAPAPAGRPRSGRCRLAGRDQLAAVTADPGHGGRAALQPGRVRGAAGARPRRRSSRYFCPPDLIAKVDSILAVDKRGGIRLDPAGEDQSADTAPDTPVRELAGVRPPLRAALRCGFWTGHRRTLHDSPRMSPAQRCRFCHRSGPDSGCDSMLAAGRGWREWADCMTIVIDVCAAHKLLPDAFR